jgi:hypothetical protein
MRMLVGITRQHGSLLILIAFVRELGSERVEKEASTDSRDRNIL